MIRIQRRRIPAILATITIVLASIAAVPTRIVGGTAALSMMALGAGISLVAVLGGWWIAQLAFRGPDRFATKLVVGGFMIRIVLLLLTMSAIGAVTGIEVSRFILWLVVFYFALVLAEAVILAAEQVNPKEGSIR